MGLWDSALNWVGDNWEEIGSAAIGIGGGIYQASQARDQARAKEDLLRQQAQAQYDAEREARQSAMSGGGGGFNTGGYMSALAAQQAQQAALIGQAIEFQKQKYKDAQKFLKPYREEGYKLLPKVSGAYQSGLDLTTLLGAYLAQPGQLAKLNGDTPAYDIQIPLPEHLKYGR